MKINMKPIRRKLKAQNISQLALAKKRGCSESTMSRYLHDKLPLPAGFMLWLEATVRVILEEREPLPTVAVPCDSCAAPVAGLE